jgi:hypothetical protein
MPTHHDLSAHRRLHQEPNLVVVPLNSIRRHTKGTRELQFRQSKSWLCCGNLTLEEDEAIDATAKDRGRHHSFSWIRGGASEKVRSVRFGLVIQYQYRCMHSGPRTPINQWIWYEIGPLLLWEDNICHVTHPVELC